MTTSSDTAQRGLDAAPIVYSLLRGHPASAVCESVSIVCTDDAKLGQTCVPLGLSVETPIPAALRQQMTAWESAHLPPKGLARLLHHVRTWLDQQDQRVATEFWNQSGAGSHLPGTFLGASELRASECAAGECAAGESMQ